MTYCVGIKYDEWTPAVETAVFRDLTGLQSKTKVQVICSQSECDSLLNSLGIQRLSIQSLASFWLLYQVKTKIDPPESAEHYITRNFIVDIIKTQLDTSPGVSVTLPEQGADNYYNPFEQAPPANSGNIPIDPRVALLFT